MKMVVSEGENKVVPILWCGENSNVEWEITLLGKEASVEVWVLLIGRVDRRLKMNLKVVHEGENTKSRVVVKGILADTSNIDVDGMEKIMPGAKGSDAWLGVNLLLLSSKAMGKAVPNLEIGENDVKAGHGATVGRINDLEMFYLMSRGLSKISARHLIVEGFLENLLTHFPDDMVMRAREELQYLA